MEERSTPENQARRVWINEGHIVFRALDPGRACPTDYRCAVGEFPRWSPGAAGSLQRPPASEGEICRN